MTYYSKYPANIRNIFGQRKRATGSTRRNERRASRPDIRAINIVMQMAKVHSHQGRSTLAPTWVPSLPRTMMAGTASAMPDTPIQNDWARTDRAMRQRGMPRARKTAYSLREAAVAAYNVWLVTTAPTARPKAAAKPRAMPALVLVSQCQRLRKEKVSLVKAAILCG